MRKQSGGLHGVDPRLALQTADSAWTCDGGRIGVLYAGQKWFIEGRAGDERTNDFYSEPVQSVFGVYMYLVLLKRLARIIRNPRGDLVPIYRYRECRVPMRYVKTMGSWSAPHMRSGPRTGPRR